MGRQDGKADAQLRQHLQGFQVYGGFGEPHAFGRASEAALEVANAPQHLRMFIAPAGQGQDQVVVGLGYGRTMAGKQLPALLVSVQYLGVGVGGVVLHPGKQGGSEIEADAGIVVNDLDDVSLVVEDAGGRVGRITLRRDALVPVVVGVGGILDFHRFQPGVFPRRLIEVTMDAEISFHAPRV